MKGVVIVCSFLLAGITSLKAQTDESRTVSDVDGNIYSTIRIGNYEWMAENLKTTTYNDGTKISNVTDSIAWQGLTTGAYCWYGNKESNGATYGALYNWYAVNTGKLCPDGWRVPTDDEWKYLEGYADTRYPVGDRVWDRERGRGVDAGDRLKSTSGWCSEDNGSDNLGFSALPGGERCSSGRFFVAGRCAFWWTGTEATRTHAWYRQIIYGLEDMYRNTHPKWMGFSIRCLRDN